MLKIVLIDDEQLIINHLIKMISSFDIPHQIVGSANNNRQALNIIRSTHPNLVITDICMGASNGLDLCEILKTTMPRTKIIILSGFDTFDYAQKALTFNVHSYLLKPVNQQKLYETLKEIHAQIELEQEQETKSFLLKQQLTNCLPLMQDWFFKLIYESRKNPQLLDSTLKLFHIDILNSLYQVIYINLPSPLNSEELENGYLQISQYAQMLTLFIDDSIKRLVFYDVHSLTFILSAECSPMDAFQQKTYTIADKMLQYLDFNHHGNFSIGLSSPTDTLALIKQSVKDAVYASNYSFYVGFGKIICITDIDLKSSAEVQSNFKYIQEDLLKSIKLCDKEESLNNLHIFYLNVLQLHNEKIITVNKFIELYYYLSNAIQQEFNLPSINSLELVNKITVSYNSEKIKELMSEYIITIIDSINELRENKSNILIQKTKEYILANYNHDISLESIAHEIGLSTCYLSTLFKSIEDTSIKEYIIDVRINAAKELLKKENLKIYEISADVGYTDSRYFSQLFRKKTGYTPGQYREFVHKT